MVFVQKVILQSIVSFQIIAKSPFHFTTIVHSILYVVLDFTLLKFLSDFITKFKSLYENTRVSFREILFPNDVVF